MKLRRFQSQTLLRLTPLHTQGPHILPIQDCALKRPVGGAVITNTAVLLFSVP